MSNPVDSDPVSSQERQLQRAANTDNDDTTTASDTESVEQGKRDFAEERRAARIKLIRSTFVPVDVSQATVVVCRICLCLVVASTANSHYSYHEGQRNGR